MFGNVASPGAAVTHPRMPARRSLPLPDRLPRALPEAALLFAVYSAYKYGRKVANGHTEQAFRHAHAVWGLERGAHLPSERLVQRAVMHWEPVIHTANYLYATVHFPAMALFLAYMFLRRRAHYLWIRRAIVIQTALALVGHLFYPLAPPRLLQGSGMVDTAARYGPAVYHGTPQGHSMANQFAAMPSLHVGWALAIAVGMIAAHRSRWRWLWLLHPLVTLLVVVSTANHYWLDCFVGCALLGLAVLLVPAAAPETAVRPDTHWLWPLVPGHRPAPAAATAPGAGTASSSAVSAPASSSRAATNAAANTPARRSSRTAGERGPGSAATDGTAAHLPCHLQDRRPPVRTTRVDASPSGTEPAGLAEQAEHPEHPEHAEPYEPTGTRGFTGRQ